MTLTLIMCRCLQVLALQASTCAIRTLCAHELQQATHFCAHEPRQGLKALWCVQVRAQSTHFVRT